MVGGYWWRHPAVVECEMKQIGRSRTPEKISKHHQLDRVIWPVVWRVISLSYLTWSKPFWSNSSRPPLSPISRAVRPVKEVAGLPKSWKGVAFFGPAPPAFSGAFHALNLCGGKYTLIQKFQSWTKTRRSDQVMSHAFVQQRNVFLLKEQNTKHNILTSWRTTMAFFITSRGPLEHVSIILTSCTRKSLTWIINLHYGNADQDPRGRKY